MVSITITEHGDNMEVVLPQGMMEKLGLKEGDRMSLIAESQGFVLQKLDVMSLEQLLEGSTPEDFALSAEDKEWLNG